MTDRRLEHRPLMGSLDIVVATGLTRVDGTSTCSPAEASAVEATRPHTLVASSVFHRSGPGPVCS